MFILFACCIITFVFFLFLSSRATCAVGRLIQEPEVPARYPVGPHTFVLLPLIQEGQLSVIGENISKPAQEKRG